MENLLKGKRDETSTVVVEKLVNYPPSRVWKAITDREQMKKWYFSLDDFKAEKGFEFRFAGEGHKGERYMHVCRITEIIPEKKLQYSWQYEGIGGYSLVSFELIAMEENKTKLILTHEGLDSFPRDNADFKSESFQGGWQHLIGTSLPDYLEEEKESIL